MRTVRPADNHVFPGQSPKQDRTQNDGCAQGPALNFLTKHRRHIVISFPVGSRIASLPFRGEFIPNCGPVILARLHL
jgi:hypothetical protein